MRVLSASETTSSVGEVVVIYTTAQATQAALAAATALSKDLRIGIRVLMLQVVPYPLRIDEPSIAPRAVVERILSELRSECADSSFKLQLVFCRDFNEALAGQLKSPSVVVIGGRSRFFASREQRIARTLRSLNHQVLFVPTKARARI